jgi:hypothetical protein
MKSIVSQIFRCAQRFGSKLKLNCASAQLQPHSRHFPECNNMDVACQLGNDALLISSLVTTSRSAAWEAGAARLGILTKYVAAPGIAGVRE